MSLTLAADKKPSIFFFFATSPRGLRFGLYSTSVDDELVFNNADLSLNRNILSPQSQQIISKELPEVYIESPMWVGTGT